MPGRIAGNNREQGPLAGLGPVEELAWRSDSLQLKLEDNTFYVPVVV